MRVYTDENEQDGGIALLMRMCLIVIIERSKSGEPLRGGGKKITADEYVRSSECARFPEQQLTVKKS